MRNKITLALPILAMLLVGCGTNNSSTSDVDSSQATDTPSQILPSEESSSQETSTSVETIPSYNDVKTAIMAMQACDNFYIEKQFGGEANPYYKGEFAKNYFFESVSNVGFLEKDDMVLPFYYNQKGDLVNKEALNAKHVFGTDGVIPNMDVIDTDYIASGNTFQSQKRVFIKPLLQVLGYEADNVYNSLIGPLKFEFKENKLHITVNFQMLNPEVGQVPYVDNITISRIGEVKNLDIEQFIESGKVFVLDPRLIKVRELFAANNFVQYQYDEENIFQVDIFNPNYFVTMFTKHALKAAPALAMQQYGYVVISHDKPLSLLKDNQGNPMPLLFDDTYKYQFFGDYDDPGEGSLVSIPHPKRPGYAAGAFQEVIKDIPEAFHYPIGLALFNNLDLLEIESAQSFSTMHKGIIDNFVYDFNIAESLAPHGGCVKLEIVIRLSEKDDSKSTVSFKAITPNGNYFLIDIKDFGAANFKPFDDLLASIK